MKRTLKAQIPGLIRLSLIIVLSAAMIVGGDSSLRVIWKLIWTSIGLSVLIGTVIIIGFVLLLFNGITPNTIADLVRQLRRQERKKEQ